MPLDTDDLTHLSALFHIVERAQGHPKLRAIGDEAMKHLEEYAESLKEDVAPEPDPMPPEPEFEVPHVTRR